MIFRRKFQKIHMVGIGGTGMSGIAEVLHNLGFVITGSDLKKTDVTERLEKMGIRVYYGHKPENINSAQILVISTAIPEDNPEVVAAQAKGIPVIRRAEMLAELMRIKYSIAVSGSHGKTTTTSMVGAVLEKAGLDPTLVVGGRLKGLGSGAKLGQSEFLVAEADESDGSFLMLYPTLAIITNIDKEHLDTYKSFDKLKDAFVKFANSVPFYGAAIVNLDDPHNQDILPEIKKRVITYGLKRQAEINARDINLHGRGSSFKVFRGDEEIIEARLNIPGLHNVKNALAAFAVGFEMDIHPKIIRDALSEFSGVMRRMEIKGETKGITFMDDYGHHPSEINAVLETLGRFWQGRIIVVFQPHRYTRTKLLHHEFGKVFHEADVVIITKLYPAGEKPIPGVDSALIYNEVKKSGHKAVHLMEDWGDIKKFLKNHLREGDLVLTLGAGDVWKIGVELLRELKNA